MRRELCGRFAKVSWYSVVMHGFHQQCIGKPKKLARLGMIGYWAMFFFVCQFHALHRQTYYTVRRISLENRWNQSLKMHTAAHAPHGTYACTHTHTHLNTRLKVSIVLGHGDTSWIVMSCHDSSGVSWDVLACFSVSCWRFGYIWLSPCAGSTHERFELYNTKPWWKALPRSHLEMWWKIWKIWNIWKLINR